MGRSEGVKSRFGVILCIAVLAASINARAQQGRTESDQRNGAEFIRLIDHWQRGDDPEGAIAAIEAALNLEPKLTQWPLQAARERVKSTLLIDLGYNYQNRLEGSRAENLEHAIQAYEAALTVYLREAFQQDWAWGATQYNLGNAYAIRHRGERADNIERAIKAYDAALTVTTSPMPTGLAYDGASLMRPRM
jgi:tetratricopeptide (TPR) repeat protein